MPIKDSGTLYEDIALNINDNNAGEITASDLRGILYDVVDSRTAISIHNYGNTSGSLNIDLNRPVGKVNVVGNITSAQTVNKSATISKSVKIWMSGDTSYRSVALNNNWQWLGTKPSGLNINAVALLTLSNFGSTESEVIAAYEVINSGA